MLFKYTSIDTKGGKREGTIDAINMDVAVSGLQRRGLTISSITPADATGLLTRRIKFFERVSTHDIVILSRQIATLFEARVSALRVFRLLAAESVHPQLKDVLAEVADDIQGGAPISTSLSKHPAIFSVFYVNMVRAGEETGKMSESFVYLAEYLDRIYEVTSKARSALVYPAFVVVTFIGVIVLMMTTVIPKLSVILVESGQEVPLYTKIVISVSDFFVHFGIFILIFFIILGVMGWRYVRTKEGSFVMDRFRLSVPYLGDLYRKMYLSRIADNMATMLGAGIPMLRALEITSDVSGSPVYQHILSEAREEVRGGSSLTESLTGYEDIPGILLQMIRVGEESGELGSILGILATFYRREVQNAIDAMVSLIEPLLIITLGVSVGFLLASVLIPIYNIASGIS